MENKTPRWTLGELAQNFGGELRGPADLPIERPVPADTGDPLGIAFAESSTYLEAAKRSGVGAILIPPDLDAGSLPAIAVARPRQAFGQLLAMVDRPLPLAPGVHPLASIHPDAEVDPSASVGPYAVIEAGAKIGPGARIFPFAYIGENCQVGEGTQVYPHAVLVRDVRVGKRGILHPGCVLGADGFGFAFDGQRRHKIPQVGSVELGDDVEIGAITAVDRATAGVTRVGDGTKLDNLVMIGHNVTVGKHTVIASLTGVSGSSHIGDRVVMAGQCAVTDHATIGDDITLGGRTGVAQNLTEPGAYLGTPAAPIKEGLRSMLLSSKLHEMLQRIRTLERRINKLDPS